MEEKRCYHCGALIDKDAAFCPKCGYNQNENENYGQDNNQGDYYRNNNDNYPNNHSKELNERWLICLILSIFVGTLGIHRFFVGKIGTAILMVLTIGGFGIWQLIDIIIIVCGNFKDKEGNTITMYK